MHDINHPLTDPAGLVFIRFNGICELDNGDIILSGEREHPAQPFIMRTNSTGANLQIYQWGDLNYLHWVPWLVPLDNHRFMVGHAATFDLYDNTYKMQHAGMMLFDTDIMQPVWNHLEPDTVYDQFIMRMIKTPDGGYARVGSCIAAGLGYVGFIEKWNSDAMFEWRKYYAHPTDGPTYNEFNKLFTIAVTPDNGFLACGSYRTLGAPERAWAIKLDACGDLEDLGCPELVGVNDGQAQSAAWRVWPNPFNATLQATLPPGTNRIFITNTLGKIVCQENLLLPKTSWDFSALPAGVYLFNAVGNNGKIEAQRILKE